MRYVTYYSTILDGIREVEYHRNKKEAISYFKEACKWHFAAYPAYNPKDAPCSYGFPHRRLFCVSIRMFNRMQKNKQKKG